MVEQRRYHTQSPKGPEQSGGLCSNQKMLVRTGPVIMVTVMPWIGMAGP